MMRYSVQPRDIYKRIFVKGYGFLSFAENMGKNIGKNTSKNLSSKICQKLLDNAKQSTTDAIKIFSKRVIQNENDEEIPKERYMSPEKRQEIIDDLRLK